MKRYLLFLITLLVGQVVLGQNNAETRLDTIVYKINNGIYDTITMFEYTEIDTIYTVNLSGDTVGFIVDTSSYKAINICLGDSILLRAYGLYSDTLNRQLDNLSLASWAFGDGSTLDYANITQTITYAQAGCYDVSVSMMGPNGDMMPTATVRVRIAENPIKKLYEFGAICSTDSLLLNVGYTNDAFVVLKDIDFEESVTKEYAVKTFIPDGMNQCATNCFTADVNFDEFPQGRTIMSADDICSVCINMEHSYMGDYRMSLVCPTGQHAVLKYGTKGTANNCDPLCPTNAPDGSFGGGGQYLGIPYGGSNDGPYDNLQQNYCDSVYNMFGEGLEYCFSRNGEYTFMSGRSADINPLITDDYIASTNASYQAQYINYMFQPIPAPYLNAGTAANPSTFSTKRPSNHDNKTGYYAPAEDFTNLIGCPLNGTWSIEICDFWPADNGWVFSWNMDICGINNGSCEYKVNIDSVLWFAEEPLSFRYKDSLNAYISANDTSGIFPMFLNIYDNFNCVWKDTMDIKITQTPTPDLGDDVSICQADSVMLIVNDIHKENNNYSYMWEPYGDTVDTVYAHGESGQRIVYLVETTNTKYGIKCANRDSVIINIKNHPRISFEPSTYPLEGCEPFILNIENLSSNVNSIRWEFGDNTYLNSYNPVHTYCEGKYDLAVYCESQDGCVDSLVYPGLITVFSSPESRFSWEPVFPTVSNPMVKFQNQSSGTNAMYIWEIQYDKDQPYSYHTLTEFNPAFVWETNGRDISGQYGVNLIAITKNIGPSGHIVTCVDTTSNVITIVNDFIQFPNLVTPNGDGYNDTFVIVNLLSGAYPTNALWIYNKWGALVYHVENISDETDFWNPNKTHSPDGTYFFRFSGIGYTGSVERHGAIEVLR